MNRVQYGNWIPGAVLRIYSKRRGVWHYGIAGPLDAVGMPTVFHASKDRGCFVWTTYEEFAEGEPTAYTWFPYTLEAQRKVQNRAESQLGRPFRLLDSNCEDYVNWIVTGAPRSPQREAVVLTILVVLLLGGLGGMLTARA